MTIRVLPSQLIDQIAAGEVVERPASAVKELIENSLDAGAKRIELEVEAGGTRLIRIRDDGVGIAREDLEPALSRHATSKIASLDDLENISTLGFRGEALPSIASVAQLKLTSHASGEESGWSVQVDGAVVTDPRPAAHPSGTTIEVRDLFFNTPARRKFLKTERTEVLSHRRGPSQPGTRPFRRRVAPEAQSEGDAVTASGSRSGAAGGPPGSGVR